MRIRQITWCLLAAAVMVSTALAELKPTVPSPSPMGEPTVSERTLESDAESETPSFRVELDKLESPAWKRAIQRITKTRAYEQGYGQATLIRVILEGEEPAQQKSPSPEIPTVNGVKVRVTGGEGVKVQVDLGAEQPPRGHSKRGLDPPIVANAVKLNTLDSFPGGGGAFEQLNSGDFVILEHINNSRRRGGKDLVSIHTKTHGSAEIYVPVTERGELGVFGDVVLSQVDRSQYGRLIAEVRASGNNETRPEELRVGAGVVGGIYGDSYEMKHDSIAATRLMAPGKYLILLPTNETSGTPTNRWTVEVKPCQVTYLMFEDPGEGEIKMTSKKFLSPTALDLPRRQ